MDLGSGISLYNNDQYKLLAAEIQTQSKKLISFQHGGNFGKFNFSIQDEMEKVIVKKDFYGIKKEELEIRIYQNLIQLNLILKKIKFYYYRHIINLTTVH